MPRYLLNIDAADDQRIRRLIGLGVYSDLDHIVSVALRNQLLAEEDAIDAWPVRSARPIAAAQIHKSSPDVPDAEGAPNRNRVGLMNEVLSLDEVEAPATVAEPRDPELAETIFWAQYYKNFPLKVAGRVLYRMSQDGPAPLNHYARRAVEVAARMYPILRRIDLDLRLPPGERLATSFPKPSEKSMARFSDQYLITKRPRTGLLDGFLARSRFANVVVVDGKPHVGLTRAGAEFVKLPNPVLNQSPGHSRSLGEAEVAFLVSHLRERVPREYNHMLAFLDAVSRGANDRQSLDDSMRRFYEGVLEGANRMTPEHVSSMRAGVQSRLQELSLIVIERDGRSSVCKISEQGAALLRSGPVMIDESGTQGASRTQ